ncbi:MAG TPA: SdrD B-like domain-containing protein [Acidimicrobiia bacterium]|nr:SdrD B-like domain-containing protein [Acidimicrobiia bacterium]
MAAALAVVTTQLVVLAPLGDRDDAEAATSIAQVYYTPFEAQEFIGLLRSSNGNPGCCSGPVVSSVSITSGADANTVYYDHFEDGYEVDPLNPVQASTLTLSLDSGDVWSQTSNVPVDPRGAGNHFDGRDKIVSSAPIAVTQSGYATTPGTVHAGAVQVLDLDKSGTHFDIPIGQDADYNQVFEYVGLVIVGTAPGTTVNIDADADGTVETTTTIGEGETYVVDGGVNIGATVDADAPVAVYAATGDVGSNYEGRLFELYPTAIWSDSLVSPVGSVTVGDGTRVFLFNPGVTDVDVDVTTGGGATSTLTIAAGGQQTFLLPVDEGARFVAQGGAPIYGLQAVTSEGTGTATYDWGFTLVPTAAATPTVIVPYGPGSRGNTNNYSPLWVAAAADTTLYVDLDGDPATGALTDPAGNQYDFSCAVSALDSYTVYDDGTTNCYAPSATSAAGGDRDMTGARAYTVDGTRLFAAWGERSGYVAGDPALDMGTTILPYPAITLVKSSTVSNDVDADGRADPGDTLTYSISMTNDGIVDIGDVSVLDAAPANTTYVTGSATLDALAVADDASPYSPIPSDVDSPDGALLIGTVPAGTTRVFEFDVVIDDPFPLGVSTVANSASMTSDYGTSTTIVIDTVDLPPLRILKTSSPASSPVGSGDTIPYTIQVHNADDLSHTGVTLTDALPAGVTYVAGTVAADVDGVPTAVSDPPNLVSSLTLDSDEILTVTFDVTVDAPMATGIPDLVNTATVDSDQLATPESDDATDPTAPEAELSITKTDGSPGVLIPGDPITYTLTVENLGPDWAESVSVVDTLPAGVTYVAAGSDPSCVEAPAGTVTCSIGDMDIGSTSLTVAVTIDPGVEGTLTNTATVSSPTPDPSPGNETDTVDTVSDAPPSVVVTKTASPTTVDEPGATVTFSVDVENTSIEPVTLTFLSDDVFGDLLDVGNAAVTANSCAALSGTSIGIGATAACTFDAYVAGDASDPDHVDTVTATVTDDEADTATDSDTATVAFGDSPPSVVVTKTATPASLPEPGGTVTFTVDIENTSVETVVLTTLTDDVFGDLLDVGNLAVSANTCPGIAGSMATGLTLSCSFQATVTGNAAGADHVDTVTATVVDDEATPTTDSDSATVAFTDVAPSIDVTKTPSVASVAEPGGPVTFTVGVSNPGIETVTLTTLTDDVFGDVFDVGNGDVSSNTCVALAGTALAGGASTSCSFAAALVGDASDPDHVDTVTITVHDDEGTPATDSASATVGYADVAPVIEVTKTPSVASVPEPGGTVTFTVRIENTGIEEVTVTSITDDVFGDLLDAGNGAVSSNACLSLAGASITVGGATTCAFDADLVGNALDPDHVDTVTATVIDDDSTSASDSDSATVAFGDFVPTIVVTKTPSVSSVPEPGGTVTFTVTVENTSPESVTLTSLTDDVFGDLLDGANTAVTSNTCAAAVPALLPGGVLTCSFDADVIGNGSDPDHVDTVTATVVDDEGSTGTDTDSATVRFDDIAPNVEITKTATPTWVPEPGAAVVFDLSITNPTAEPVGVTSLVDNVFGDLRDAANAEVWANDCGAVGVLAPFSTATCSFTALVEGDASSGDHVDVVTIQVSDDEGNTAADTDSATVEFVDVLPDVDVAKSTSAASVPETGQTVTFTVTIENASAEPVTVTSIVDDVFGDLGDSGNPAVSAADCHEIVGDVFVPGEVQTCTFDAWVAGTASGPDHVDTVTVTVIDDDGSTAGEQGWATVGLDDVAPAVTVDKAASVAAIEEPSDTVTFTVRIDNTGTEPVWLVSLDDDVYGDLLDPANPNIARGPGCPSSGDALGTGSTVTCTFVAVVAGDADGPDHENTVEVVAADDEGTTATAQGSATVAIDPAPVGTLEGLVWWDVDDDHDISSGEPRLPGIDVRLLDASAAEVATTVTGPAGGYGFEDLAPGAYTVVVDVADLPYGLALSVDPDSIVDGRTGVTVLGDDAVTGLDFGARGTVTIGDRVWEDANRNGVQDADEPSIANAEVTIRWAGPDDVLGTTDDLTWVEWTAGGGRYERDDLPAGLFEIEVDTGSIGSGLAGTTPARVSVVLAAGADYQDGDFGFAPDDSALPNTGMDTDRLAMLAVGLIVLGVLIIAAARLVVRPVRIDWGRLG